MPTIVYDFEANVDAFNAALERVGSTIRGSVGLVAGVGVAVGAAIAGVAAATYQLADELQNVNEIFESINKTGLLFERQRKAAEELLTSVEELKFSFFSLKVDALEPLIPVLNEFADSVANAIDEGDMDHLGDTISQFTGEAIEGVSATAKVWGFLGDRVAANIATFNIFIKLIGTLPKLLMDMVTGGDRVDKNLKSIGESAIRFLQIWGLVDDSLEDTIGVTEKTTKELAKLERQLQRTVDSLGDMPDKLLAPLQAALDKLISNIPQAVDLLKPLVEQIRKNEEAARAWAAATEAAIANVSAFLLEMGGISREIAISRMSDEDQIIARMKDEVAANKAALDEILADTHLSSAQKLAAKESYNAAVVDMEQRAADEVLIIQENNAKELKDIEDARFDEQQDALKEQGAAMIAQLDEIGQGAIDAGAEYSAAIADAFNSMADSVSGAFQLIMDDRVAAAQDTAAEITSIEEQIAETTDRFEKKKLAAQIQTLKKQEKAQKDAAIAAFVVSKAASLGQAVINTALAVSLAWATVIPPANIAAAIAAGVAGAIQIATIAAQPPPSFHTGGIVGGNDEMQITALKGEGVVNRMGMSTIGEDTLNAINRGQNPLGGTVTVIQKVNNKTTNTSIHEVIRTRAGAVYDELVRTVQPKSGTRVPSFAR